MPSTLVTVQARLANTDFFAEVRARAVTLTDSALRLRGTVGSLPAFVLADLAAHTERLVVAILAEREAASYLRSDLEQLVADSADLLYLPPTGQHPYDAGQVADPTPIAQRADVLQQLREGFAGILVTSVDALSDLVPPPDTVADETLTIRPGDEIDPQDLMARLVEQGFEAVEFVGTQGEVAIRGGILDVFPFAGDYPVRIEFFGDEIDGLREFDPATQRSLATLPVARLVPNLDAATTGSFTPLFTHLPDDTLLALFDSQRLAEHAQSRYAEAEEAYEERLRDANTDAEVAAAAKLAPPEARYLTGDALTGVLSQHGRLLFGTFSDDAPTALDLTAAPQPAFNSDMSRLRRALADNRRRDLDTVILCDSASQRGRLTELLTDDDRPPDATLVVESIHEGFEVSAAGLAVYTDHQLFNRYHRPTARRRAKSTGGLSLRELKTLTPGDFVVHVDYGIGQFAGLHKIKVREKQQEAVKLTFRDGDALFVNVSALHKLHKYSGKEGHQPRLTKLGTGAWERLKARTKKRVKDIARDLIQLYAKRKQSTGFGFQADTIWQQELEASFPYEDTPDQAASAQAVKDDMELPIPMDRLVCGDVGFGKTEIAVRAAFKAVQDGKQVAVIVPTTILAAQHVETFAERMKRFPVQLAQLSRFVSAAEQKEVASLLKAGEIDIVIGTVRLLSKDIQFRDLGLLVVDEEQKFGVSAKEKLRKLRPDVDTLTLTATPIPRTLQFSLMGARDLSIISTPPPNRQPIVTEIHAYDQDLVRDAILYEVNRGGQVFFVHNRVKNIEEVAGTIRALVPNIRIQVAHGQMKPTVLEGVMHDFMDRKFDVLVCTNIVESGLDVSNANTIIINHAERFGLSDLHQLRGRVGRRGEKAFCYLLVPSVHTLTREARQRLRAVEEFSDLGSGFNIAMRDLDIRGAGALLGAEQSGFIEDVGYETYHQILDEAVQELRRDEFRQVFDEEAAPPPLVREPSVDIGEDAFIPEAFVSNHFERLNLYRRLSEASEPVQVDDLARELRDRFGSVPKEVTHLLASTKLGLIVTPLRLLRVQLKNNRLWLDMPTQEEDLYFYEVVFNPFLERLAAQKRRYVLRDTKKGRLRAIIQDVKDVATAERLLLQLLPVKEIAEAA
ncbi:MAG: transcription-repair coupling factor [Bacteroidota bacterium]